MEKLRNSLISLLLVLGAGALLYRFGLTKEARNSVKQVISSTRNAYNQIESVLSDMKGVTVEESILPNRASTISQWEKLGF